MSLNFTCTLSVRIEWLIRREDLQRPCEREYNMSRSMVTYLRYVVHIIAKGTHRVEDRQAQNQIRLDPSPTMTASMSSFKTFCARDPSSFFRSLERFHSFIPQTGSFLCFASLSDVTQY